MAIKNPKTPEKHKTYPFHLMLTLCFSDHTNHHKSKGFLEESCRRRIQSYIGVGPPLNTRISYSGGGNKSLSILFLSKSSKMWDGTISMILLSSWWHSVEISQNQSKSSIYFSNTVEIVITHTVGSPENLMHFQHYAKRGLWHKCNTALRPTKPWQTYGYCG